MNSLLNNKKNIILSQLIIIHIVGVIGLNLSFTKSLFEHLSWFNLLLSAIVLHFYMDEKNIKLYIFYILVFIVGIVAEIFGVHTQILFGDYYYTNTLGCSVLGVPLIIGINWIVLTFCTAKLVDYWKINSVYLNIAIGAFCMVLLDILLEFFAVKHQLWIWVDRDYPTVQNFIGWFIVSIITHSFYRLLIQSITNSIAIIYLGVLIGFLLIDFLISFF